jgi:mutator protein MutT
MAPISPISPVASMGDHPEICVGAIAVVDGQLLMVRRGRGPGGGRWSIPGGRVERGETTAEAVVRELAEETGLEALCDEFVGWVERISDEHHFVILDFRVTVLSEDQPTAGDDAAEAGWVPLEDVASLPLVDGLAEFLHENGILPTIV